jgi:hypothetical protein
VANVNILVDRHHADLLYSLQLTYEPTHDLFVPMDFEWWDAGYWQFGRGYGDDRLAQQFLRPEGREVEPGLWLTFDDHHPERPIYGVSLERARSMDWESVCATVDDNQQGFARFAREHGARYLYHIGNARQAIDASLAPTIIEGPQRFDLDWTFRYREPVMRDRIVSFVNLLPLIPEMWAGYEGLRERLPSFSFASYGHSCPDGLLKPVAAIAEEMARAGWAYHDKVTGDGFGHILANWAAVGRPLIGHASYYAGQWGEALWVDGATCIDLDRHSLDEAADIIRKMSPERHAVMCAAIRDRLIRAL